MGNDSRRLTFCADPWSCPSGYGRGAPMMVGDDGGRCDIGMCSRHAALPYGGVQARTASSRNSSPETSSSWTTSDRTRAQASAIPSKPLALGSVSSALQSRLQSDRKRLRQTQGPPAQGHRANHRGPLDQDRRMPSPLQLRPRKQELVGREFYARIGIPTMSTCSEFKVRTACQNCVWQSP